MKSSRLLAVFAVASAALLLLAIDPVISTLDSPKWEVWTVDEKGQPLPGMTVRLNWRNYSLETDDHTEDRLTDQNGYVIFPAKMLKVSLRRRLMGLVWLIPLNIHDSSGPHAFVFAFGNGLEALGGTADQWNGRPNHMQSRLIAK